MTPGLLDLSILTGRRTARAIPARVRDVEKVVGQALVKQDIISPAQLKRAHTIATHTRTTLREVLEELGYLSPGTFNTVYSVENRIPLVDLREWKADPDVLMPQTRARRLNAIPYAHRRDELYVAIDETTDPISLQRISYTTKKPVRPRMVSQGDVFDNLPYAYRVTFVYPVEFVVR
jgi:hypothetical protein